MHGIFEDQWLILDNPETITYLSSERSLTRSQKVEHAWRQSQTAREVLPTAGVYTNAVVKWFLPRRLLLGLIPKPGDRIALDSTTAGGYIDEHHTWTVLDTAYEASDGVYELNCLDLVLAYDLRDSIDVLGVLNRQDDALGRRAIPVPKYESIPARIQEIQADTSLSQGRLSTTKLYNIMVGERLDVTNEDQILDRATGLIYDIKGYTNPDRFDELQVINAERGS